MRPLDTKKIEKIIQTLRKHPEGAYISEIAREAGLPKSTVSFLLSKHMSKYIREVKVGKENLFKNREIKVIKL